MNKPETQSDVSPNDAKFWLSEIEAAQSRNDTWYEDARKAEERYRDEDKGKFGALNIFWSNVETQKSAIGKDFGKPQVTRLNMPDNDGGLSRHVANIWERTLDASVKEATDNHDISLAVNDLFIAGKGQVWLEVDVSEKKWVSASLCRVCYKDYLEGNATRWGDVPWVARRHYFTHDELVTECGLSEDDVKKVPLNFMLPSSEGVTDAKGKEQFKRAEVWEIWSKFPVKSRIFVATGYNDRVLRFDEDPLGLKKFFPCPRPMLANGDESKAPLTDYSRYQDQAEELDHLSNRIFVLTGTLRRIGIHDKAFKELMDLAEAEENTTIAVENWAQLQANGGLAKVQEWQDILPIAQTVAELHKQRDTLLRLIYELSGISDLARGHTDPDETLGAQKLKQSFGSSRFKSREKESRRFASDAYEIKGEVVAELFPREQIEQMSGIALPLRQDIESAKRSLAEMQMIAQQMQSVGQAPNFDMKQVEQLQKIANTRFAWEDVASVLRSDLRRCYSVAVETDQTAFVDEEADKANRTQFFQVVMQSLQMVGPMIASNPKNGEVFKQLLMFNLSAFRSGRSMEEGIEQAIDNAIMQASQAQQQPQQDPNAALNAQVMQLKIQQEQIKLQKEQVQLQQAIVEARKAGAEIQLNAQNAQIKSITEQQKIQQGNMKLQQQAAANQIKMESQRIDTLNKAEQLQFERETRATAREAMLAGPTQTPQGGI